MNSKNYYDFEKDLRTLPEKILISAIWFKDGKFHKYQPSNIDNGYVVTGFRHSNVFATINIFDPDFKKQKLDFECGFLTSKNKFLNRSDAMKLAKTYLDYLSDRQAHLCSEDLW